MEYLCGLLGHTGLSTGACCMRVFTMHLCGNMSSSWSLVPKGNFYFLEGSNDALLCGNSSDAG